MLDCVVLGAGISGLSTAYYLRKLGVKRIAVLEKGKIGGKIGTVREDGFIVEKGPNGFLDNKPFALELVKELGMEEELYPSSDEARHRFLLVDGRLVEIPLTPKDFFSSSVLSLQGKLEVLKEPFVRRFPPFLDPSVGEFCERRLGAEMVERLIDPMVAGVYGGRAYRLSMKSAFPLLWRLEQRYGSLVRALLGLKRERRLKGGPAGPGGRLVSLKKGLFSIIEGLCERLKGEVVLAAGCEVEGVKVLPGHFVVKTRELTFVSRSLVVSAPAYEAARMLEDYPVREALSSIPYVPMVVVALGYERKKIKRPLNGFGFLVPEREGRKILGCLWDSRIFPNRAPSGYELFRMMLGGARSPELFELSDEELADLAVSEISDILNIEGSPDFVKLFRYERAIPQYTVGHEKRLEAIESFLVKFPGLFLNSNAYRGVALNDCVGNSKVIASKVAGFLS